MDGMLSLERVAQVVAEAPATEFKLGNKGFIRPGFDADIVLFFTPVNLGQLME